MKMSKMGHEYCIRLFPDISTTADATEATQKCKDVLNDTTAYNPKLHSKFEISMNKLIYNYKMKLLLFLKLAGS